MRAGAGMVTPRAVWMDFRCMPQQRGLCPDAKPNCDVLRITRLDEIHSAVAVHRPRFFCIEYDYPDQVCMRTVPLVMRVFPAQPRLMIIQSHAEARSEELRA